MFGPFQKVSIVIGIILCLFSFAFAYSGGSGEPNDPYRIAAVSDWQQLMSTSSHWNKYFIMTADVNLQGVVLTPVGFTYHYSFSGVFDGNGHIIRNVVNTDYTGLFGYVDTGGQIRNLNIEDANVSTECTIGGIVGCNYGTITDCYATGVIAGGSCCGEGSVGGLVGINRGTIIGCHAVVTVNGEYLVGGLVGCNYGTITGCYATGTISNKGDYVGGLTGVNVGGGTITNCYATGTVTGYRNVGGLVGYNGSGSSISQCYSTGAVGGNESVGGLVGKSYQGTVTDCYATGSVSGEDYVGGLVGNNVGTISVCYATGAVSGNSGVGGLVGMSGGAWVPIISYCYSVGVVDGNDFVGGLVGHNAGCAVTASFWDVNTSGQTTSYGGTGKTTAEMKTLSTFTSAGWDFTTEDGDAADWVMPENDYPHLGMEYWRWARIPDISGMSFEEAVDTVKNAGFLMGSLIWINNEAVPIGHIVSQYPPADINGALEVTKVDMVISCPNQLSAGSGTETDPYQIRTVYEWLFLTCHPVFWDKYFILENDLDFRKGAISPIGSNWKVFFAGVFDGNSHIVRNVVINMPSGVHTGLFGFSSGQIRKLGVESVGITGGDSVGGLVGYNNDGVISNCYTTGAVNGNSEYGCIGGLVGVNGGTITACYATDSVSGNYDVGGLVGVNGGTITACYATGAVSGSGNYVGGLVGDNWGDIITACFWDIETSGQTSSVGGTGKTTAEMQNIDTFLNAGWDFVGETANGTEDIWTICEGINYPKFTWQNQPPIAEAGPDQTAYAWIDGIAEVDLDGLGSSDPDCNGLTYYWSWVIDGNTYEANGVNPTIELPVGVHTIQLVVNDGLADSVPDDVNITVIAPLKIALRITPRIINRCSRQAHILAFVRLPEGIMKKDISSEPLTLYPGDIEASRQWVIPIPCGFGRHKKWLTEIFAFFDKDDVLDAIPTNGRVELKVAGELTSGQYFYGSDTVIIISPKRPWHFPKK